jgi:hypothetical protein
VATIWREAGVQPWRAESFRFSTDPELVAKVVDVVGLYLDPQQNTVVHCVDELGRGWGALTPLRTLRFPSPPAE